MAHPSPTGPGRCIYNVPLALEQPLQPLRAKYRNLELVDTSQTQTVGPMPVPAFLDEFMPVDKPLSTSGMRASRRAFNSVPEKADTPSGIYQPLIAAMNTKTKHKARCPGFVFLNASERTPFPERLGHMKPHICCYTTENSEMIQGSDPGLRAELGYAELFIEVKSHPSHDFFVDPPDAADPNRRAAHDFLARSDTQVDTHRDRAFGQHLAYIAEIFAYQHRTFLFSISLSGSRARLLRWDRAGCVVTESFDIRKQPQLLCDFLWRFSHMPDAGRGHDPTVERASIEEEAIFVEAITRKVQTQLALNGPADGGKLEQAVSEHYERGHVVAIHVLERRRVSAKHPIRRFIVSRPVASSLRPFGKGTKGFWAVEPSTGSVVFLKDTWRLPPHSVSEGDTIHLLRRNSVNHVPSVICHGDVPDFLPDMAYTFKPSEIQATMTDEFCGDVWPQEML
uniref:Anthranilate--CoA ligase (EC) n=1 Tax=Ganoderma boninense TaxID=34458 RepID=A0A5K1K5G8_9APHY|nr:Anthranilate--CoA ligase (EC [Ganoderma boninense]